MLTFLYYYNNLHQIICLMSNAKIKEPSILTRHLYSCRKIGWYLLLFSFVSNLLLLAIPIYSLQVLDRVISSGSMATLLMLTLVVILALAGMTVIQMVRSTILVKTGDWLDRKISPELVSHTISNNVNSPAQISGSQLLRDFQTVKNFLAGPTFSSLMDIPWSLIFILVLFAVHSALGFLALAGIVLLLLLAALNEKVTKNLLDKSNEQFTQAMGQIESATRNAEVIEAMGMLPAIIKNWEKTNLEILNSQVLASNYATYYGNITKFVRLILQIAVTGISAYLVLNNSISTGALIASSILVARAMAPFENAISSWKGFIVARKSYDRIEKSLSRKIERDETTKLPTPRGNLTAENTYFTPPGGEKPIIKGINFALNAGEILAIIGHSAAGKSTLARLITGVWKPNSGNIRLDGADVYKWSREDFGKHVGYLPQDVELFSGSVKDNIARMNKDASSEDVIKAARIAGVHEMILRLPKGYETDVGNGGMVISAGQRQRIGLARAFYGNPNLIILDEPNSNLDSEGEIALINAFKYAKANRITTILITHRTPILGVADKIMVMQDGVITMFGPKNDVLRKISELKAQAEKNVAVIGNPKIKPAESLEGEPGEPVKN